MFPQLRIVSLVHDLRLVVLAFVAIQYHLLVDNYAPEACAPMCYNNHLKISMSKKALENMHHLSSRLIRLLFHDDEIPVRGSCCSKSNWENHSVSVAQTLAAK